MTRAVQRVSREESLQAQKFPVFVRRATHTAATARLAHDTSKVMLVNFGASLLTHEAGTLNVYAGQVVLLPHGHWYSGSPSDSVTTTTAYIDTAFLREQAQWMEEPVPLVAAFAAHANPSPLVFDPHAHDIPRVIAALRRLLLDQRSSGSALRQFAPVAEIFDALSQSPAMPGGRAEPVRLAVALMLENLEYGWTLELLAEAVALSKSQLTRLFLQDLKLGPAEFLRQQRCRRMAELLVTTPGTIDSIARQVGWANASHASRAFRSIIGLSPQQYRSSSQGSSALTQNRNEQAAKPADESRSRQQASRAKDQAEPLPT